MKLKSGDMRFLEGLFEMGSGYVLNFNDRTLAEFFDSELSIDIDDVRYREAGNSKGKRVRTFLQTEEPGTVARALRALWEYRDSIRGPFDYGDETFQREKAGLFALVDGLEGASGIALTDPIDAFTSNETLEELVAAIGRDIRAGKPQAALDRLHTYCMKKFAHVLDQKGIPFDREDPLHSRAGKYIKALEKEGAVRDISLTVMKSSISIFDKYNDIRNNASFAHDNQIVDRVEARFIFDAITNILRFMKGYEANRFGA